jgi:hypothetical protein
MDKTTEAQELTTRQGYEWIKSASGTSYLCPAGSIADKARVTEADLKKVCVDESGSPQND